MQTKKTTPDSAKKAVDSVVENEQKNVKTLDELKSRINQNYADIEHKFWLIGVDLIKVNLLVKNFRKWISDNLDIDVSTAYTLMRLVKRDKEMQDSKKYQELKPRVCLSKLIKLLKYPEEFVESLDFEKKYTAPGGKQFDLADMPRDLFNNVVEEAYKVFTAKAKGEPVEQLDPNVPMDRMIISQAKEKLDKMVNELQTIFTVLSEVNVSEDTKDAVAKTVEELEGIEKQASHIHTTVTRLLETFKKEVKQDNKQEEKPQANAQ